MKKLIRLLAVTGFSAALLLMTALTISCQAQAANQTNFPTATPESQGFDSRVFVDMLNTINRDKRDVRSLLIMRRGKIVLEFYRYPYRADTLQHTMSVGKSVISTLAGLLLAEGAIDDVRTTMASPADLSPSSDSQVTNITLQQALSMTTGLDATDDNTEALNAITHDVNWVKNLLAQPMTAAPGKRFGYASFVAHWVSIYLQQHTIDNDLIAYAQRRLFRPLGIDNILVERTPTGQWMGGGGLWLTPRDMLAFGQLYLQNGHWQGKQLLPKKWVKTATRNHIGKLQAHIGDKTFDKYGYFWWVYDGAYAAQGVGGQLIFVIPELDTVAVMTAADPDFPFINNYVLKAMKSPFWGLTANPKANAELSTLLAQLGQAQSTQVSDASLLTEHFNGYWYSLAAEDKTAVPTFCAFQLKKQQKVAQLNLKRCDGKLLTLTLDSTGNPRLTPSVQVKHPQGNNAFVSTAQWLDMKTLAVDFHELGYPVTEQWTFTFDKKHVKVERRIAGADKGAYQFTATRQMDIK